MANTLTNLIPDLFAGLNTVSRELVGFIPAVARDSTAERAAVNEAVRYHIAPAANVGNIAPAMTIPEPTDQTIGSNTITITKARAAEFGFVGEERLGLDNGSGFGTVQGDMVAEALRALVNEIETDLAVAAVAGACRATGTAGTTPFAANTSGISNVRKILMDNGAPQMDLQLVLDTTSGAALRTLWGINADRDWSSVPMNQQGVLVSPHGVATRETGQEQLHTAGTGSSATTDNAGYAVGATTITLASAGTGTILTGDVVVFAGDTNEYLVVTGDADVSNGGTIVLQAPGLRQAIPTSATAITVRGDRSSNVAFYRRAIQLVTRAPALPAEGDAALDRIMLTDPRSGLTFEFATYAGYRKIRYEVALAWGVGAIKSDHIAILMG